MVIKNMENYVFEFIDYKKYQFDFESLSKLDTKEFYKLYYSKKNEDYQIKNSYKLCKLWKKQRLEQQIKTLEKVKDYKELDAFTYNEKYNKPRLNITDLWKTKNKKGTHNNKYLLGKFPRRKKIILGKYKDNKQDNNKVKKKLIYRKSKCLKYWLFIKPTVSNIFAYVYNALRDTKPKLIKPGKKRKRSIFIGSSIGLTGYKGPTKTSFIAAEEAGKLLAKKIRKRKIFLVNLVLFSKLTRRIREFLKGLKRTSKTKLKIRYIYSIPKRAHNGCRIKSKRRK